MCDVINVRHVNAGKVIARASIEIAIKGIPQTKLSVQEAKDLREDAPR